MAVPRIDGSIQSHALPEDSVYRDYAIYRCQITRVLYTDDPENLSYGAQNPQVVYEAIVVGGSSDGRVFVNVRDAVRTVGGYNTFEETVLVANQRPVTLGKPDSQAPNQQYGDVVYIVCVDGNPRFPIIIGHGTHPLDSNDTGAASTDGPRKLLEYNGVQTLIDKSGNYKMTLKGGTLDTTKNFFNTNKTGAQIVESRNPTTQLLTITFASGLVVTLDGQNDAATIKAAGGGELKISQGKVALGAGTVEIFAKLIEALGDVATAAGTLSSSTVPATGLISAAPGNPVTGSAALNSGTLTAFSSLQTQLNALKAALQSIAGTL